MFERLSRLCIGTNLPRVEKGVFLPACRHVQKRCRAFIKGGCTIDTPAHHGGCSYRILSFFLALYRCYSSPLGFVLRFKRGGCTFEPKYFPLSNYAIHLDPMHIWHHLSNRFLSHGAVCRMSLAYFFQNQNRLLHYRIEFAWSCIGATPRLEN